MDIREILEDWKNGKTHGEILAKHSVSKEQEYAITLCSEGLNEVEIGQRLSLLTPGMKAKEIKARME